MMMKMRAYGMIALVCLAFASAAACSDDANTGVKTGDGVNNANNPDTNNTPTADPIRPPGRGETPRDQETDLAPAPASYRLEIQGDADLSLNYYNETALTVRYLDEEGQAIRGGQLRFDFVGSAGDHVLSQNAAVTNAQGDATVLLGTGRVSGTFRVQVTAEKAEPVEFTVRVLAKDNAAYVVHTTYRGVSRPELVSVRLYDASVTCAQLDPGALPAERAHIDLLPLADLTVPDARFLELPNNTGYTAVSLGLLGDVPMAWGCNDSRPLIEDGFDQEVEVLMEELRPQVEGSYDVETRVDLIDALPEPWRTNLDLIGRFFTDPADALVFLMLGDPNDNNDGWLGGLFLDSQPFHDLVYNLLSDLINPLLPPELRQLFTFGANVYRVVTQFTLAGYVDLGAPAADGTLVAGQVHRYDRLRLKWNCDQQGNNCDDYEIGMTDLSDVGYLSGEFSGRVATYGTDTYLLVDRHAFTFNYGALILSIFEQLIFPEIFGPGVDTMQEVLESFIDCQGIANAIDPQNVFDPFIVNACHGGVSALADQLLDQIAGVGSGVPNLSFGTFPVVNDWDVAQSGCQMLEPVAYPEDAPFRYFERLGTPEDRCAWDAQLITSQEVRAIRSDFFGVRAE